MNSKNLRDYHAELRRIAYVFACPHCKFYVLPERYEHHCNAKHFFDSKTHCVWCDGRNSWPVKSKSRNASHLLACFRAFACSRDLMESDMIPPASPRRPPVLQPEKDFYQTAATAAAVATAAVVPERDSMPSLPAQSTTAAGVAIPSTTLSNSTECQHVGKVADWFDSVGKDSVRINKLLKEREEWLKTKEQKEIDIQLLTNQLHYCEADRQKYHTEIFNLQKKLEDAEIQLSEKAKVIDSIRKEMERLQIENRQYEDKVVTLKRERRDYSYDRNQKQAKVEQLYEKILTMNEVENSRLKEEILLKNSNGRLQLEQTEQRLYVTY